MRAGEAEIVKRAYDLGAIRNVVSCLCPLSLYFLNEECCVKVGIIMIMLVRDAIVSFRVMIFCYKVEKMLIGSSGIIDRRPVGEVFLDLDRGFGFNARDAERELRFAP